MGSKGLRGLIRGAEAARRFRQPHQGHQGAGLKRHEQERSAPPDLLAARRTSGVDPEHLYPESLTLPNPAGRGGLPTWKKGGTLDGNGTADPIGGKRY